MMTIYTGRVILTGNNNVLGFIDRVFYNAFMWRKGGFYKMSRFERIKYAAKHKMESTLLGVGRKVYDELGEDLFNGTITTFFNPDEKKYTIEIKTEDKKLFDKHIKYNRGWANQVVIKSKVEIDEVKEDDRY